MFKKVAMYLVSYVLTFFSVLAFITCLGYYILFFDWQIPGTSIAINAAIIVLTVTASIAIYGFAEKIKKIS